MRTSGASAPPEDPVRFRSLFRLISILWNWMDQIVARVRSKRTELKRKAI